MIGASFLRPRTAVVAASAVVVLASHGHAQQMVPLTQGMVIDRSIIVRPGTYHLRGAADLRTPALTIRGSDIVVDFNGATIVGSPGGAEPDEFAGVAILIEGGSGVTVKGATIRGFKVGILARNSPGLRITRNDLSYNWKQRLYSGIEKESLLDWMSYHQNEKDEWLRFGAAIYVSNCDRAEIDHNTAVQGQNGLMATASKGLKIWNNAFQYLSSIGVGLYRVTGSTIMHNRIDWCVRGYSHGYYNRGQDSAGLLMYEQSSNNTVAYNSITHGGDGLFLWAGQSTMDTGQGGSNDNVFYRNDFSHAPTNGIEATFSRNLFAENRVEDCWHGVWGGYSFESQWLNNRFARNAEGVAIEHGQEHRIEGNTFDGDDVAIRLWQNAAQDPNWGYPKMRDTRSRDFDVWNNTFKDNRIALSVRDTRNVKVRGNTFEGVGNRAALDGDTTGFVLEQSAVASRPGWLPDVTPLPEGIDAMLPDGARRGRETIIIDEWGPYDWKSPKLWPVLTGGDAVLPYRRRPKAEGLYDGPVKLNVLGPDGEWRLVSARGAEVAPARGKVGDVLSVTPRGTPVDYELVLEYRGGAVTSPRGAVTPAGQPYRFSYSRFFAPVSWSVRFFEYPDSLQPAKQPEAFAKLVAGTPLKTLTTDRLDYLSGGVIEEGVPRDRFAFIAEGTANLPAGEYSLQVISDDGARVWVDGRLVLDAWEPHGSRVDEVTIEGGRRRLKVEYYDIGGWAEMRLDIQPRRGRR
ncbi:MAG TPA: right-handed parallel beta-helix repeat-containing protein [Vicinamibacterales bacterium]|nr:right-handed parallel beta-helix repeat-containing protein [Vicinamibacterales bacterium]